MGERGIAGGERGTLEESERERETSKERCVVKDIEESEREREKHA
jgi:hypothetical protein